MEAQMAQKFFGFKEQQTVVGDTSCENELEELMQQIDIMVNSKKVEWEKEVQILEQRLEVRDQELSKARGALDQKDCEIGILSKKLAHAEHSRKEIVQSYEDQLEVLKSQLCKVKKGYEKIHFYSMKSVENEHIRVTQQQEKSELQCLSQKLEEFRVQATLWEKQRFLYQKHIKALSEQRKALAEQCELFQKQSQGYQEQLSSWPQLPNGPLTTSHCDLQSLKSQLDTCQERIRSDGLAIENLQSAVQEITLSRDSVKEENQQLLQQLRNCQMRCQKMETELSEASIELQARDDLLRAAELDHSPIRMDIDLFKKSQGNELSGKESNTSERTMNKKPVQKRVKRSHFEKDEVDSHPQSKKSGDAGLESVRANIYELTNKLNRQDVTVATLSEKLSELERGMHVREQENADTQVPQSRESQCAKESRVLALCRLSPSKEEEPLKCTTTSHKVGEDLAERVKAAPHEGNTGRIQSQENWKRSDHEESHCKMVEPLINSASNLALLNVFDPCDGGWGTPLDQSCLEAIFPSIESDTRLPHGQPLPQLDFSLIFVCDQKNESLDQEESFISAAERFLHEENRRAEDFEKILNSHIEELQRQSEHTVTRYTSFNQSKYIATSSRGIAVEDAIIS